MQNIKTREVHVVKGLTLITNPELIKVMVIKPKFIDQIEDLNLKQGETFFNRNIKYLGKVVGGFLGGGTILFIEEGKDFLQRINFSFFAKLWNEEKGKESYRTEFNSAFKAIPQIFIN